MKSYNAIVGAVAVGAILSAVSSRAQLNFGAGASVVASLTGQELTGVSPLSNVGMNDGSISTWVVSDSSLDSQGLIFVYQVENNGPDSIDQVSLTGSGFVTSSMLAGSGVYSGMTGLSFGATPSSSGNSFVFEGQTGSDTASFQQGDLAHGGTSDYLVVFTDINSYYENYGQDQDDFSAAGNIDAPVAPVPEANTIIAGALMIVPLGVGFVRALRKERSIR